MAISSSNPTRSPSAATSRADKNKQQARIVVLKLSPQLLQRFEPAPPSAKEEDESTPSSASSPAPAVEDLSTLKVPDINDNASESNSTPAPSNGDTNASDPSKKRKGPAPGYKRSLGQMIESSGTPKPRGKPGPKKKPRLEDGTIDHNATRVSAGAVVGFTGHKLGPKANQGAINAGLRALDRSGKPCRKWNKKPFQLKSFTGIVWDVPSWRGNETLHLTNVEESSDAREISQQSSSDLKPNESDVAMSNAGDQPDTMLLSTPAASSPVPMPEQTPSITARG
ncbi:uncharacterized protein A1O9_07277 [Exophiala aquamarina CBS 119918]|uniref:INO80 complex subunit Ies4 n=1 Tax=Exophiala aquamarina CBS 119918 TaxID=1182545 RepID=A0A072PBE0_9EURO|nr:uncharacterized protein A1O9_07277 [Exophiala aquamarina CBS 119918]KEF57087.1 hypothetical protein A1O9_07277 [Exophiala aquamarina CBS 119918]